VPLTKDDIRNEYPLPVYNYRVEIGGSAVAFSEVSGLSISYETSTYKESPVSPGAPGPRTMIMPGQRSAAKITLKKGIVRTTSIQVLYDWIKTIQINQIEKKDVFIRLCDEKGDAVISWKVFNAFPTKLDAPSFDAKSNDAAIESMELSADFITIEES
jgi:phage tail-like protein